MKKEKNYAESLVTEIEGIKPNSDKIIHHAKEELNKKDARKASIKEGCFATLQGGFGDSYVTPFAVAINSSNSQIGLLSSIPGILGPLSQLIGSRMMEKYSRKKIVSLFVFMQALMWLPIIAIAFLFWKGLFVGFMPVLLIIFLSAYVIFGNLSGPAWFSWMGDIVDEKDRGRYFSMRNRITGGVSIVATIIAAFFLDFFQRNNFLLLGFSIFFFIAFLGRTASSLLFSKQYEPKFKVEKIYYFSFWQFVKKMPFNNFGRFTIFRTALSFAVSIAGPFFAVYLLRTLQLNYVSFILVSIVASIYSMFVVPLWGKFSDRFGNYKTMKITSVLVAIFPLLWCVSKSPYFIAFVPELLSGIGWSGFNLASSNYIYDCVTKQRRGLVVSYYNLMNGIGVFLGASFGAYLASINSVLGLDGLILVFIVSSIFRIIVVSIGLRKVREVRAVSSHSSISFLHFIEHRVIRESFYEFGHLIGRVGKKGKAIFGR